MMPELEPWATPRDILNAYLDAYNPANIFRVEDLWDRATPLERHIWIWCMGEITGSKSRNPVILAWEAER